MKKLFSNWIGDQWVGSALEPIENINPSDLSDCIGAFAQADQNQLNEAVANARAARMACRSMGIEARQTVLQKIGEELMARAEELGRLLSREEGKPLAEGKGEVFRAGQFFTYFAAETLRQLGENADSVRPNIEIDVRREPMGVVAVISPWNFPTATAAWKIAPALAFGNAVIWKPANETPASAHALTDIIARAGLPEGAFQLLMGRGSTIGQGLAEHPHVDAITFTGSYETGRKVAMAASGNLTKYQLELGSKNALLVMDDADMGLAVNAAIAGGYSGSGQKCTASSRLIVHENIHDEFVAAMVERLEAIKIGDALDPSTQMGPIVSQAQLESNLRWLEKAKAEGAECVTGGERVSREKQGHYMSPALLIGGHNKMSHNQEEMFAPAASVQKISSYEEGLATVNDTDYGLVAGIFTQSLARATHFRRSVETGCVTVNLPTAGTDYHVPFGGRKNSSSGPREQGRSAAEFYTQVKTAYIYSGEPV